MRTLKGARTGPFVPNLTTDVLLHGDQTGGRVSVVEIVVPPHSAGPPLHRHDFDEAFYVLGGELIFQVEETLEVKGAGELSFAPRNVAHALANHSDAPARYALICTPAGFERHWARMAAEAAGVEPPQWARQPIPEVTVVGPPIAAQA
jgi:quercetin dioxygenase-like cupin family protein